MVEIRQPDRLVLSSFRWLAFMWLTSDYVNTALSEENCLT